MHAAALGCLLLSLFSRLPAHVEKELNLTHHTSVESMVKVRAAVAPLNLSPDLTLCFLNHLPLWSRTCRASLCLGRGAPCSPRQHVLGIQVGWPR